MSNDYVKVKKRPLLDCLTCPLCASLYREATTISVCLHTFCKHCIFQKLDEYESNCCPVCKAYLGSFPKDQLRPDHNLREVIQQIFPFGNSKRRECPLDNVRTPVITRPGATAANALPQDIGMAHHYISVHGNKDFAENNNHQDQTPYESSKYSSTTSKKQHILCEIAHPQVASTVSKPVAHLHSINNVNKGPTQKHFPRYNNAENGRTQTYKTMSNAPSLNTKDKNTKMKNAKKIKRKGCRSDQGNDAAKIGSSQKMSKPGSDGIGRFVYSGEQLDQVSSGKEFCNESSCAVWFCLLPCEESTENALPPMPKPYVRARNGDVAVSCINKYLVHKLNLKHESEVEVMCCCQPVLPTLTLNNLIDMWAQATSDMRSAYINSTGEIIDSKNFVMELTYRRSKEHRTPQ